MDLEEILIEVGKIDGQIELLKERRLAVLRNDSNYAAYLDRTNGELTIAQFHTKLSNLQSLYRDLGLGLKHSKAVHDIRVMIVMCEQELGI